MNLKRYDEVLASSDAYLMRGEPSVDQFEIRGLAPVARRDYAAAIADYHRALELKPEPDPARRSKLLNLRGWAYHFTDAPRLALPDFEESIRLDGHQSDAYAGRGLARIRLGQWGAAAVADAEIAIDRTPRAGDPLTSEAGRAARVQALFQRRPDLRPGHRVRGPGSQPRGRASGLARPLPRVPQIRAFGFCSRMPLELVPDANPGAPGDPGRSRFAGRYELPSRAPCPAQRRARPPFSSSPVNDH